MKCAYCGKRNKDGATVCKRCGVALPVAPQDIIQNAKNDDPDSANLGDVVDFEEGTVLIPDELPDGRKPAQNNSKKPVTRKGAWLVFIAALLGIAAIAVVVLYVLKSRTEVIIPGRNSMSIYGSAVFYNGGSIVPDGRGNAKAQSSVNGETVGILTYSDELYCVTAGDPVFVSGKVVDFAVSSDGSAIAYMDDDAELWCFEVRGSGSPVRIESERIMRGFAVSPNGKAFLYVKESDEQLYSNVNGTRTALGDEYIPISISDGGGDVYCFRPADSSLYYINKRGRVSYLRGNVASAIYLNSRHDEIIFSTMPDNGAAITMYCCGAEPIEVVSSMSPAAPVLPASGIMTSNTVSAFTVSTCPIKYFEGKLFVSNSLVRFHFNGTTQTLEEGGVTSAVASDNYKYVVYTCSGELLKRGADGEGDAEKLAEDCVEFAVSTNGNTVWYLTSRNELHCKKEDSESLIAVDTDDWAVSATGSGAIFISGGKVYCNKEGNPDKSYLYEALRSTPVFGDKNGLYYYSTEGGWTKLTNGGKKADPTK